MFQLKQKDIINQLSNRPNKREWENLCMTELEYRTYELDVLKMVEDTFLKQVDTIVQNIMECSKSVEEACLKISTFLRRYDEIHTEYVQKVNNPDFLDHARAIYEPTDADEELNSNDNVQTGEFK